MPNTLTKLALAAAMSCAALPGWGAGMPDYGTKNFTPGGDAPAYFSNESGAVLGVAADEAATDDGADRTAGSLQYEPRPERSARARLRHHDKFAGHQAGSHSTAYASRERHSSPQARNNGEAVGRHAKPVRSSGAVAKAGRPGPSTIRARPARPSARHAAARSSSRKG
jgi:hypothetical protein